MRHLTQSICSPVWKDGLKQLSGLAVGGCVLEDFGLIIFLLNFLFIYLKCFSNCNIEDSYSGNTSTPQGVPGRLMNILCWYCKLKTQQSQKYMQ